MTVQCFLRLVRLVRERVSFIRPNPRISHGLARVGKKGIMD